MSENRTEIILSSLLVGGTVISWAHTKSGWLSRWSIIGVESKTRYSSHLQLV